MSAVEKLLIQGIRSFGPTDDQKGVIQFGTPLTLITGQNGAGKTTVIECLKYVTTGDLPPNSKGGAFVHDPKLVGEREVRAVVKLKFRDISGTSVVCHRMLQSTQKAKKIEQRSLDSSLEKVIAGVKRKITSRCAEVDAEMINHMGVSKAILNHVIFCHQEESFWPLSESTVVKKKFDQIFAATRYTKALDYVKTENKKQIEEGKRIEMELQHLQKNKEEASKLETQLRDTQQRVDAQREEIERMKTVLRPAEARLQELNDMYDRVTALQQKITGHDSSRTQLLRTQEELQRKIDNIFTGSEPELQQAYDDHNSRLVRSKRELEEVERKYKHLSKEVEEFKVQLSDCHQEHGQLKTQDEYHQRRLQSRDEKIASVGERLKVQGYERGPFSSPSVRGFLKELGELRARAEQTARREKQEYLSREQRLQSQLDALRTNLAQLEHSRETSQRTMAENKRAIATISRELAEIGAGGAALEATEQDLATAERELAEQQAQCDVVALEAGLEALKGEKRAQDASVTALQQEMAHISQQASARGALDAFRKDRRSKEEAYQNEMCALEPDLLAVLGHVPTAEEDQEAAINNIIREKQEKVRRYETQLQKASVQLTRTQTLTEQATKELSSKKSRMEALQAEVADVCDDTSSYEEAVQDIQTEIEDANENLATVKGSQAFFRKSLGKIHMSKKCPLCVRGFDSQAGFEQVVKTITDRLNQSIPKLLPQLTEKLQSLTAKQQQLERLRPKMEERTRLRGEELPRLQAELEARTKEAGSLQDELKKMEGLRAGLQQELELARALLPRVGGANQRRRELHDLDRKISSEQSKIRGDASRNHFTVGRELTEAQRNTDELNRKMDHKRQEISDFQRLCRQLEDQVHKLREEKLRLQGRLQERQALVQKKGELTAQNETMGRQVKLVSNQLGPVGAKMADLEREKGRLAREREEVEETSRAEEELLRTDERTIKENTETIRSHESSGAERALGECEQRLGELRALVEGREGQRRQLEEHRESLQRELANSKVKERELEDNLQLLRQRRELAEKEAEIRRLRAELKDMGLERYEEEYCKTKETVDNLNKEQARVEGQKEGLSMNVRQLQRQLQNDLFRDSEKKYTRMLHKQLAVQQTKEDLKRYHSALDHSIMAYHKAKMTAVNSIVKDLWIKTYKGGDIDYIELRSDSGLESEAEIGARRVYNYRIVMMKNDHELDMRGRCSAGQKVIASIIIRLALAETFCLRCGILALDEPTTNLDSDNVEGLAESLADIVKARSGQRNFQLIVITHDMAFIELLSRSGYTDCYYRVSKEVGETSRITKQYFSGREH